MRVRKLSGHDEGRNLQCNSDRQSHSDLQAQCNSDRHLKRQHILSRMQAMNTCSRTQNKLFQRQAPRHTRVRSCKT
eukprot:1379860-Alexandrium_andersonii.AAC.1